MTLDVKVDSRNWNLMPTTELEEVAQNVQMVISSMKGSVPMDRTFGVDPARIDDPISVAQAKLSAEIAAAIREQEPRARVQKIFYSGDPNDGQLLITARIEIVEKRLRGYVTK